MNAKLKLVMIYGSVRPQRFCDTVARWAAGEIERDLRFTLERIDPAEDWPQIDETRLHDRLSEADAILVVTPEYNHSFPGPLKVLIDSASREWHAKPVGFVSYGGFSGGLRAVEHLRGVFAELHAVAIRDSVSFPNAWEAFGMTGMPTDAMRYARSMRRMLSQLAWWARALRNEREASAYGEAA